MICLQQRQRQRKADTTKNKESSSSNNNNRMMRSLSLSLSSPIWHCPFYTLAESVYSLRFLFFFRCVGRKTKKRNRNRTENGRSSSSSSTVDVRSISFWLMCFSQSTSPSTSTQSLRLTAVRFADLRIQGEQAQVACILNSLSLLSHAYALFLAGALSVSGSLTESHAQYT